MTTDKEHAALEWLDGATHPLMSDIEDIRHTNTLKSMLARLPSPTDHAAIDALAERAPTIPRQWIAEIIRIMHEPPAPKTKTVQVWRVEFCEQRPLTRQPGWKWEPVAETHRSREEAERNAALLGEDCTCIRVTGPHDQEVPIEVAPAADGCRGRTLAERRA